MKNWLWEVLKYVGRPDWLEGERSESRLLEAGCFRGTLAVVVMSECSKRSLKRWVRQLRYQDLYRCGRH